MTPFLKLQTFYNESPTWVILSRVFFLFGIALWMGALIFFRFGIIETIPSTDHLLDYVEANSGTVQALIPTNPFIYLSQMMSRLNFIESVGFCLIGIAFLLAWIPRHNRNKILLTQTFVMACMGILLLVYIDINQDQIQQTLKDFPFDLHNLSTLGRAEIQQKMSALFRQYSIFTSINAALCGLQILLYAFNPLAKVNDM